MRINRIEINNFRNFREYAIDFASQTSVLIGKNGMGKTNIIASLAKTLNFIFSQPKDAPQYDFIRSSDQNIKGFTATDPLYGPTASGKGDYTYPVCLSATGTIGNAELCWQMRQENGKSRVKEPLYREAYHAFWEHYNNCAEKPVLAFFSDSFPHRDSNISNKMRDRLQSGNPLPQNVGYYKWDDEQSCVEIWVRYFCMQWVNNKLQPDENERRYVECVTNCMIQFSTPISDYSPNEELQIDTLAVEIRGERQVLVVKFLDGREIPFNSLPQGYHRMFSIVFDIANRSYILNDNCNPEGIALIDEIELHLHPSIAKEVLGRMRRAFPRLQFIVSTHSPLVITNFKQNANNYIYKLYYDEENVRYTNERIEDIYGLDYNSGLTDVMDTSYGDRELNGYRDAYKYWKGRDAQKAERVLALIRQRCGNNSRFLSSLDR